MIVCGHIHTNHSFDCLVPPHRIVDLAVQEGVNYLIVTDHDTTQGSLDARRYVARRDLSLEVPVAAEYSTDVGDVLVVGVPHDFVGNEKHEVLCKAAKEAGGWTILPHPFVGHDLRSISYDHIDCVEVFNPRCTPSHDDRANTLCQALGKHPFYGCDAHFLRDILRVTVHVPDDNPLASKVTPLQLLRTPASHMHMSQVVKGLKTRRPVDVVKGVVKLAMNPISSRWQ